MTIEPANRPDPRPSREALIVSMDITQDDLNDAGLVVIVSNDEDGRVKWSATRSREEVVDMLHLIAEDIEAGNL